MLSNTPLHDEPSAKLRALLDIRDSSDFRCHGIAKTTGARCKYRVAVSNALAVNSLLEKAAAAKGEAEKERLLRLMAPLTLCQRYHQYQQSALVAVWQKLMREAEPTIKHEDDDGTYRSQKKTQAISTKKQDIQEAVVSISEHEAPDPKAVVEIKIEPSQKPESRQSSVEPPGLEQPEFSWAAEVGLSPKNKPGPTTRSQLRRSSDRSLVPYSPWRDTRTLNSYIKSILSKPLTKASLPSTTPGFVYIYTFTPDLNEQVRYLKIGYTTNLQHRLRQWGQQCGHEPKLLCYFSSSLYKTVERIVHAQLANERMLEAEPCVCGRRHKEWFKVRLPPAAAVLGTWTAWSLRDPYTESGLLKDEWRRKLEGLDLSVANCWEDFVY